MFTFRLFFFCQIHVSSLYLYELIIVMIPTFSVHSLFFCSAQEKIDREKIRIVHGMKESFEVVQLDTIKKTKIQTHKHKTRKDSFRDNVLPSLNRRFLPLLPDLPSRIKVYEPSLFPSFLFPLSSFFPSLSSDLSSVYPSPSPSDVEIFLRQQK